MRDSLTGLAADEAPQKGATLERLRSAWDRRKWLVLLVFALPFVGALSMIFSLPAFYRSTAVVLVDRQQVPEAFVRPTVMSELETRLNTISQEILSRARLEALITRFGLYRGLRNRLSNEEIVEQMRKDIKLQLRTTENRGRMSTMTAFSLSYLGPDPQTVALVTNTLASFYVEENLKVRERQATSTADFLGVELAATRRRLDDLEARMSDFRKRYLGELPQQMPANLATLENLHAQLRVNSDNQLRVGERRDSLNALLGEAASSSPAVGIAAGGGPSLAEPHVARLVRLQQELESARARFTEEHPTVIRLKGELAAAERTNTAAPNAPLAVAPPRTPYATRLQETLNATESDIKVLKTEEQHLREAIAAYQTRVENTPKRELEFQEVSRDYESTKQLYESLGKRHQEAQLAESMEQRQKGEQFRILDPAVPSLIPAAPKRFTLLVVSLVLSLGLAGGVLALAEMLDTSFRSANELHAFTIVPVLGSVPRIVTEADRQSQQRRFRLAAAGAMLGLVLIAGSSYFIGHGNRQLVQMLSRDGG